MRLELRLAVVDLDEISASTVCVYADCGGRQLRLHQVVSKPVHDKVFEPVLAHR